MSTDAATPETPARPETDGADDGSAVDGSPSGESPSDGAGETAPDETAPDETASTDVTATDTPAESPADADTDGGSGTEAAPGEPPADETPVDEESSTPPVTRVPDVPRQASPDHDRQSDAGPGPVADDAGGRLTARLREARARLQPEPTVIPAPRTPEGVVPPAPFGRGGSTPPADLLRAVDELAARLAELEQDRDAPAPERHALVCALDRSATGVPDGGWSREDGLDAESLADAGDLTLSLHDAAAALVERLDAEDRPGSAAEVGGVVTALQVARMVLDLEAFARHGR
ncbi:hypothetical protein [Actinomycetospora aeridis]|uniref:Uncharacterized protein n=1 Tax=Actinomycetospora aeridis TaxID=3129231 RepID=A0ABU8N8N5_9PSEU